MPDIRRRITAGASGLLLLHAVIGSAAILATQGERLDITSADRARVSEHARVSIGPGDGDDAGSEAAPDASGREQESTRGKDVPQAGGPPVTLIWRAPMTMPVGATRPVSVTVHDAEGEPAADQTIVRMMTGAGSLDADAVWSVDGLVTATLTAPTTPTSVELVAWTEAITERTTVAIVPGPPHTLTLALSDERPEVGREITATASVWDAFGNAVADGTAVAWSAAGPAGSGPLIVEGPGTEGGRSRARWTSEVAGAAVLTATVRDSSARRDLDWIPGPPRRVRIAPIQPVPVEESVSLQATVWDRFDNLVADGTPVEWRGGRFDPASTETRGGVAATTWRTPAQAGLARPSIEVDAPGSPITDAITAEVRPADLEITASLSQPPTGPQLHPGEDVTWTVTARNLGLATAREVGLSLALPDPVRLGAVRASDVVTREGRSASWKLPDMAQGKVVTMALGVGTDRAGPWTGSDVQFLRAALTTTTDVASTRDLVRTDQLAVFAADLDISMRFDATRSSVRPGGSLVYEVTFGNNQAQTLVEGARITETLPPGTTFDHWQPAPGMTLTEISGFDPPARELVWEVPEAVPQSEQFTLWLHVEDDRAPESLIRNRLAIGSGVLDVDPANNIDTDDGVWLPGVDLVLETDGPHTGRPGELLAYAATLRNDAVRDRATDVTLDLALAPGMVIEALDDAGQLLGPTAARWAFETLPLGASREVRFATRLPGDALLGERFDVRLSSASRQAESAPGDNVVEWEVAVVPGPPADVSLTAGRTALDGCRNEETEVTARVVDDAGHAVADGTQVRWTTDAGSLRAASGLTATGGVPLVTATTDGAATVTLRAVGPAGSATLEVTTGETDARVRDELGLTILPGAPASLALSAMPQVVRRGETSTIRAHVLDACGRPVADGTRVLVEAERGSFAGASAPDPSRVAVPTRAGRAEARLDVESGEGALRVQATHDDVLAEVMLDVRRPPTPDPRRYQVFLPVAQKPLASTAWR